MSRDQHQIQLSMDTYTELTNDDVSKFTLSVNNGALELRGGPNATLPAVDAPGYRLDQGAGFVGEYVNTLWPHGGVKRIFARALKTPTIVVVDHA